MKKKLMIIAIIVLSVLIGGCGNADAGLKPLDDLVFEGENEYVCKYDEIEHDLLIYLPEQTEDAPLIIMLHGYGESAEAFRNNVHMEEDANPRGYAVVYVTGAPDPDDPTSAAGWNSGISGSDGNDDVGFLKALALRLQKEYSFDKDRIYAAGFSNGAFMTHRLAMEGQDTFAGVASVAGKMTESVWEEKNEKNNVGVLQITGEKDDVVPKNSDNSARYSKDPAIEDVMEYWASSNGLGQSESCDIGKESALIKYFSDSERPQVWTVLVRGGRHSWPSEDITGINTNELILDFFDNI